MTLAPTTASTVVVPVSSASTTVVALSSSTSASGYDSAVSVMPVDAVVSRLLQSLFGSGLPGIPEEVGAFSTSYSAAGAAISESFCQCRCFSCCRESGLANSPGGFGCDIVSVETSLYTPCLLGPVTVPSPAPCQLPSHPFTPKMLSLARYTPAPRHPAASSFDATSLPRVGADPTLSPGYCG